MRLLWCLIVSLLLTGCCFHPHIVRDLRELPQDPVAYLDLQKARYPLMAPANQLDRCGDYLFLYFFPWRQEGPSVKREEVFEAFRLYFAKSRQRSGAVGRGIMGRVRDNANLWSYPATGWPGITVRRTDLKGLPLGNAGRGWHPLSEYTKVIVQVSSLSPNTPLYVTHISRDRRWVLVETGFAFGWLPVEDVARVDLPFVRQWQTGRYVAVVKDGAPVWMEKGICRQAAVGDILPEYGASDMTFSIAVASRGRDGRAVVVKGEIARKDAVTMPLPLNMWNVAVLAGELVGTPYSWGGGGGQRDCSSLLRDLFTPFGIWLPRHSQDQALEGGSYIDLSHLASMERKREILSRAVPFATLLWIKGHIMLYVGHHHGEPVVFHTFRNVKIRGNGAVTGKHIVGRATFTTICPGGKGNVTGTGWGGDDILLGMTFLVDEGEVSWYREGRQRGERRIRIGDGR